MIDKVTVSDCCLCKACSNICPTESIRFEKNENFFKYPIIDSSKCIKCNLCEKVCPALKDLEKTDYEIQSFASRSKSKDTRIKSSSGGLFYEASSYVIKNGGFVCGTKYNNDFTVSHTIVNNEKDLLALLGSKYEQSDTDGIYRQVKELLDDDKVVLFCGCPCQVAGIKSYLKKDYKNLYTIDVVCHGIPSSDVFRLFLDSLEKKYNAKVSNVNFRDKSKGWHNGNLKIEFYNGKCYKVPIGISTYMKGFYSCTIFKDSCYSCKYNNFRSGSDLTIGDLWGAEVTMPNLDDNTGLSATFANSEKGLELLKKLEVDLYSMEKENIIKYNKNLIEPSKPSAYREEFYNKANKSGIINTLNEYYKESIMIKYKRKLSYLMRYVKSIMLGKGKPIY